MQFISNTEYGVLGEALLWLSAIGKSRLHSPSVAASRTSRPVSSWQYWRWRIGSSVVALYDLVLWAPTSGQILAQFLARLSPTFFLADLAPKLLLCQPASLLVFSHPAQKGPFVLCSNLTRPTLNQSYAHSAPFPIPASASVEHFGFGRLKPASSFGLWASDLCTSPLLPLLITPEPSPTVNCPRRPRRLNRPDHRLSRLVRTPSTATTGHLLRLIAWCLPAPKALSSSSGSEPSENRLAAFLLDKRPSEVRP